MVEFSRQPIELLPKCVGDLEVVSLMADDIDERGVAGVSKIALGGAHTYSFAALAMQIAPVMAQRRFLDHPHRIDTGQLFRARNDVQVEVPFSLHDEVLNHLRATPTVDFDLLRQAMHGPEGTSFKVSLTSAVG